ncbi:MAG: hypothetical protein Kow0056_08400 [Coriobacteriia bacterium]
MGGIRSFASKLGMRPETLRTWMCQTEASQGFRPGLTTDEREQLKELRRENHELRRSNEIVKSAATSIGADLDRRQRI